MPIDTAKRIVPQLERSGKVVRGYLGVASRTVDRSLADLNLPSTSGALVQTVTPGSPAAKAGIRGGDIVGPARRPGRPARRRHHRRGRRPQDPLERGPRSAVTAKKPGDKVEVQFLRDGKKRTVEVTLAERPDTGRAPRRPPDRLGGLR